MLQGKTKIELFETQTGGGYFKVEDSNMVTNACYNLVNPPNVVKSFSGSSEAYMPGCITPLLDNCFSSLMLFNKTLTEDVNNIIPPLSDIQNVGFANSSYTGNNPLRGNLNTAETIDLENGKRYVWDFPTDKGNGTIRSVGLSNFYRGGHGLRTDKININTELDERYTAPIFIGYKAIANLFLTSANPEMYYYSAPLICTPSSGFSVLGMYKEDEVLACQIASSSVIFETIKINSKIVRLKTRGSINRSQKIVTITGSASAYFTSDDNYFYSFYATNKNSFNFIKIDLQTLEVIKNEEVVVQDMDLLGPGNLKGTVYNGHYYLMKPLGAGSGYFQGIYKINIEDVSDYTYMTANSIFGLDEATSNAYNQFIFYNSGGILMITPAWASSNGSGISMYLPQYAFVLTEHLAYPIDWRYYYYSSSSFHGTPYKLLPSPALPKPYTLASYNPTEVKFGINTMFLSTINNLSTPVVKNETQTMKVTYEITEI